MTFPKTLPNSKTRTGTPGAHPIPPAWLPKVRTAKRLASELGITSAVLLEQYLEAFRLICRRRSFLYRQWETAFSNCVRKDWCGIRGVAA